MMTCPHGFINQSCCPTCSKMMNVKPLNLIKKNQITHHDLIADLNPIENHEDEKENKKITKIINMPIARPTRILSRKNMITPINSNENLLHQRLKQLNPAENIITEIQIDNKLEKYIKELQKNKYNYQHENSNK